jgi:type II secretory pathway pseudopilin PulG
MADDVQESNGLGIVEVIIAMFLLAVIAVAILPALWQGIRYSSEQSAVATATRFLNSLVEQARDDGGCDAWADLLARTEVTGRGETLTVSGTCTAGSVDTLSIVVSGGGRVLASTTALVDAP